MLTTPVRILLAYDVGRPVGLFFFFFFFLSTGRPGALPAAVTLVQGAGLNV